MRIKYTASLVCPPRYHSPSHVLAISAYRISPPQIEASHVNFAHYLPLPPPSRRPRAHLCGALRTAGGKTEYSNMASSCLLLSMCYAATNLLRVTSLAGFRVFQECEEEDTCHSESLLWQASGSSKYAAVNILCTGYSTENTLCTGYSTENTCSLLGIPSMRL